MKTIYPMVHRYARLCLGLLAFIAVSCGSYQSSSYYDNDGIYGSERRSSVAQEEASETNAQNLQYKDYFSSLQDDDSIIFTDPESYTSYDTEAPAQVSSQPAYGGWGSETGNITVNVYDNWGWNSWYPSWYWGWNSWYGPSWGWGLNYGWGWNSWHSPYWGWGWNYPVWYTPHHHHYYGYNQTYYRGGRRGAALNSSLRSTTRQQSGVRSARFNNRESTFSGTRAVAPRSQSTTPRSQSVQQPTRSNNSYNTPRNTNSGSRISTPSRSSSPGSVGGGRSGGSYGGSRGGGGRR